MPNNDTASVNVTVGQDGTPSCNPDQLNLGNKSQPCTITWTLQTNGYEFPSACPHGLNCGNSDLNSYSLTDSTHMSASDSNADGATLQYTITVVATETGERFESDPSIINRR